MSCSGTSCRWFPFYTYCPGTSWSIQLPSRTNDDFEALLAWLSIRRFRRSPLCFTLFTPSTATNALSPFNVGSCTFISIFRWFWQVLCRFIMECFFVSSFSWLFDRFSRVKWLWIAILGWCIFVGRSSFCLWWIWPVFSRINWGKFMSFWSW